MIFKTIGFYALIISLLGFGIFIRSFFHGGGREWFALSYGVCIMGLLISILGIIFDSRKMIPKISLFFSIAPFIYTLCSYFIWRSGK